MELTKGQVAVVTGGASGIGLGLSRRFAALGLHVVLADIEAGPLEAAATEIAATGVEVLAVPVDVAKADQVHALAQATLERFGRVDVVCNNAGVGGAGDPWTGPIEGWEWVVGVNLWGVVHGIRAFLPSMLAAGSGHIVNTASVAGVLPTPMASYAATKHAVVGLTEALRLQMQAGSTGVGVSVLCPGWVRTRIMDSDRNWPAELGAPPPAVDTPQAAAISALVRSEIESGMSPDDVARIVSDAIVADQFWIYPHQDWMPMLRDSFARMGRGEDPTGLRG